MYSLRAFLEKFDSLFFLINHLEQSRAKILMGYAINDPGIKSIFYSFISTRNIVRWNRVLAYLVPGLQRGLASIEILHRYLWYTVLYLCDRMPKFSRDKDLAVIASVLVFEEIEHLTKNENPDPSAVYHVQLALKARLKVLCSRIFDFDNITLKNKDKIPATLLVMINRVPELSFCLPGNCRIVADYIDKTKGDLLQFHIPATPLDLPACLLRRSGSSDDYYDDRQTENCFCGCAFDSTPPGFLSLFGHSTGSFARHLHSGPQKSSLVDGDLAVDTRQAMNIIFRRPWSDDSSLRKDMIVFASILSYLVWNLCAIINTATEEPDYDPDTISKDDLDRIAAHCRPQFLTYLLLWVVAMHHEFCKSDGKSKTDVESSDEVWKQVRDWTLKREGFQMEGFVIAMLGILSGGILAETTKSKYPYLSSHKDSLQDELEELSDWSNDANVSSKEASIADEL